MTEYGPTTDVLLILLLLYRQTARYERALHELHLSSATLVGAVVALKGETSRLQPQSEVVSYNVEVVLYGTYNVDDQKKYGNIHAVFTKFDLKFDT